MIDLGLAAFTTYDLNESPFFTKYLSENEHILSLPEKFTYLGLNLSHSWHILVLHYLLVRFFHSSVYEVYVESLEFLPLKKL